MIKILIFTRKGGVGKTVTCVNLAGCLDVHYNQRVLVVDCDPQSNTTTCFTINEESNPFPTITELFNDSSINAEELLHPVVVTNKKNSGLVPTNITLVPAAHSLDHIDTSNMYVLKDFLDLYEDKYDYCIMDCSPNLTDITINALCAADYILIPSFAGRDSVNGYGMVIDEIDRMKENGFNVNIKVLGVFLNAIDRRRYLENYYVSMWNNDFNSKIFLNQIRDSSDVVNAYEFGKPVHYYKPSSLVAKDYDNLTNEIICKIKQSKNNKKAK